MNIEKGDICKVNGVLREVVNIVPHQDIDNAVYYEFHDGCSERDIRLHPEAVYKRAGNKEHAQLPTTQQGRLEDSAQISADLDLAAKRLDDAGYFSSAEHVRLAAQKLLPC